MANTKRKVKKANSLPFLPDTSWFHTPTATLPANIESIDEFQHNLTKPKSHSVWYDAEESFISSDETISVITAEDQSICSNEDDQSVINCESDEGCEEVNIETLNTDTRLFVRSSALNILAAFPQTTTVSPLTNTQKQPTIHEDVPLNSIGQQNTSNLLETKTVTSSQKPKKAKKVKKKSVLYEQGSEISIDTSESSQERIQQEGDQSHKKKKHKKHKTTGIMNVFRRKSEAKDDVEKERRPVQKSQSFNSITTTTSTSKNDQLSRMDSFRKIFRRQKAEEKVNDGQERKMEISAPIVKPSLHINNKLVERDEIMVRNRSNQIDRTNVKTSKALKHDNMQNTVTETEFPFIEQENNEQRPQTEITSNSKKSRNRIQVSDDKRKNNNNELNQTDTLLNKHQKETKTESTVNKIEIDACEGSESLVKHSERQNNGQTISVNAVDQNSQLERSNMLIVDKEVDTEDGNIQSDQLQPVAPMRSKHLERKRLSQALDETGKPLNLNENSSKNNDMIDQEMTVSIAENSQVSLHKTDVKNDQQSDMITSYNNDIEGESKNITDTCLENNSSLKTNQTSISTGQDCVNTEGNMTGKNDAREQGSTGCSTKKFSQEVQLSEIVNEGVSLHVDKLDIKKSLKDEICRDTTTSHNEENNDSSKKTDNRCEESPVMASTPEGQETDDKPKEDGVISGKFTKAEVHSLNEESNFSNVEDKFKDQIETSNIENQLTTSIQNCNNSTGTQQESEQGTIIKNQEETDEALCDTKDSISARSHVKQHDTLVCDDNKVISVKGSVKYHGSLGSTDMTENSCVSKSKAVTKTQSFPGETSKSSTVARSPTSNKAITKRHSIFTAKPQFEVPQEMPTLVTDLVPTSFAHINTDRRTQIVLELFTTERTYVRGLETIIELFQKPLMENMEEKEINTIFCNINDIFSVNKDLLFLLWEKLKHWTNETSIGEIFIDMEERFKIYASYCKNFDKADLLYKKKLSKNKEFERFLKACYQDPLCQPGLDLPSYLITVIQRIPRYLLLLKDLFKKTSAVHPDYENLKGALVKMTKVAEYLNSQLQEIHSKREMQELRSTVIGLKAYEIKGRKLLKEAEVCLMSPKKTYKCLLFNDVMVFAVFGSRDKSEIELTLELKTLWFEDLKKFDPQTNRHDAIELFTPRRPYTMYATSRTEKRVWLQKLHVAIVNLMYGNNCEDPDVLDISHRKASDTYMDGSVYCGEYLNAKRHGHGVMAWADRTRYEGSWLDDERHGYGEMKYSTGEKYVGYWAADKKEGRGTQTYVNGDVYVGSWRDGKMNGKGEIRFANGDSYVGDMLNNEADGEGELTCCTGLVYKGQWHKSKRQGKGHVFYPNGNEYIGDLFNDRICGFGKIIYFNRDEYNGEFLNEMRHGVGVFKSMNGVIYDGQWNNDFMNGQGKMTYPNGDQYTGTWHQNKRVGKGQMMYSHGNSYIGQWDNDLMNGKGVMYYKDGAVYEGTWQHGERHGYGTMVYHDKSFYEGEFDRDFCNGRGKLIYKNNVCYVGEWKKNKFEGSGAFVDPNTQYSYQGDWVNGMREGNGVEISYKTRYEGSWKADMRHGRGIEKTHAEHVFEGTWRENKKHGEGVRTLRSKVRDTQSWCDGQLVTKSEMVAEELPLLPRR